MKGRFDLTMFIFVASPFVAMMAMMLIEEVLRSFKNRRWR